MALVEQIPPSSASWEVPPGSDFFIVVQEGGEFFPCVFPEGNDGLICGAPPLFRASPSALEARRKVFRIRWMMHAWMMA